MNDRSHAVWEPAPIQQSSVKVSAKACDVRVNRADGDATKVHVGSGRRQQRRGRRLVHTERRLATASAQVVMPTTASVQVAEDGGQKHTQKHR